MRDREREAEKETGKEGRGREGNGDKGIRVGGGWEKGRLRGEESEGGLGREKRKEDMMGNGKTGKEGEREEKEREEEEERKGRRKGGKET